MTSVLTLFFFFFGFQVLFVQSFISIWAKELKYLFNWDSSFWVTLFWGCYLKFLSVTIFSANWGAVFDLEISSWFLLDTKLSTLFFHFVLAVFSHFFGWKVVQCRVFRGYSFWFELIFCSCLFVSLLFFKSYFFEREIIYFFLYVSHKLVYFSIFPSYL